MNQHNATMNSLNQDSDNQLPFLQPAVTASSSGDTLLSSPTATAQGSLTPEALRGRPAPEELREDLGLVRKVLPWQDLPPPPPPPQPRTARNTTIRSVFQQQQQQQQQQPYSSFENKNAYAATANMVLPPPPPPPPRMNQKRNQPQQKQQHIFSFYDAHQEPSFEYQGQLPDEPSQRPSYILPSPTSLDDDIASTSQASHLCNSLAASSAMGSRSLKSQQNSASQEPQSQMITRSPNISNASFYSSARGGGHSLHSRVAESPRLKVGQARTAVGALVALGHSQRQQPSSARRPFASPTPKKDSSILPSRDWLSQEQQDQHEDIVEPEQELSMDELPPYAALHDKYSPVRNNQADDDWSRESSIHASPSSNRMPPHLPDTSFTRGFLAPSSDPYDFHSILDKDLIIGGGNGDRSFNNNNNSIMNLHQDIQLSSPNNSLSDAHLDHYQVKTHEQRFRKENERKIQQDLLLSTLERLQDDPELVTQVLDLSEHNILEGWSQERRAQVLEALEAILQENDDEEDEETSDVALALSFCWSVVHTSASKESKQPIKQAAGTGWLQHTHRWKHVTGFRGALGLEEAPKSPETVRGGDTSLFSLPSDSANHMTPNTSNVSVTSTITSTLSPNHRRRVGGRGAVDLRQVVEAFGMGLDRLSGACWDLVQGSGSMEDLLEQIVRQVDTLLAIPPHDLKGLIDSFELDILPLEDPLPEGSKEPSMKPEGTKNHEPPLLGGLLESAPVSRTQLEPIEVEDLDELERSAEHLNLFSPHTVDMMSLDQANSPDPIDDLRRTVGSFESVEEGERDDADSPILHMDWHRPRRLHQPKKSKKFGFRRYFRKRQASPE
eukprot:Nitzschia sp. Nitz4//scaffold255_size41878//38048//40648//NITZ4_007413-RA/size41878-processed-gene-0.16-mRNA-1//1//CDS//3329544395//881//frame0